MLDNTARQLDNALPLQQPQATPTPAPAPAAQPAPHTRVAFSGLERLLTCVVGLVAIGFCLVYLTGQMTMGNLTRNFQVVQQQTTVQKQGIADAKQTIGELSNSERLNSYAKAHGYTVIEGNIKRAVSN